MRSGGACFKHRRRAAGSFVLVRDEFAALGAVSKGNPGGNGEPPGQGRTCCNPLPGAPARLAAVVSRTRQTSALLARPPPLETARRAAGGGAPRRRRLKRRGL